MYQPVSVRNIYMYYEKSQIYDIDLKKKIHVIYFFSFEIKKNNF